jgi:NADH:ubiquinone oxidoreductase subunit E
MDTAKIDQIIEKHRGKPGDLIHVLMEIQHENHWLPRDVLHNVAEALEIPFSRVLRIATLYKTFSLTPKGRNEVHVCNGISCHLRGAKKVMEAVERVTGSKPRDRRQLALQPKAGTRLHRASPECRQRHVLRPRRRTRSKKYFEYP